MRYRQPFIVYPRQLSSGRKIFYYQTYDQFGKRTVPQSTGKLTETASTAFCMKLWKDDKLIPATLAISSEFSKDILYTRSPLELPEQDRSLGGTF